MRVIKQWIRQIINAIKRNNREAKEFYENFDKYGIG